MSAEREPRRAAEGDVPEPARPDSGGDPEVIQAGVSSQRKTPFEVFSDIAAGLGAEVRPADGNGIMFLFEKGAIIISEKSSEVVVELMDDVFDPLDGATADEHYSLWKMPTRRKKVLMP